MNIQSIINNYPHAAYSHKTKKMTVNNILTNSGLK